MLIELLAKYRIERSALKDSFDSLPQIVVMTFNDLTMRCDIPQRTHDMFQIIQSFIERRSESRNDWTLQRRNKTQRASKNTRLELQRGCTNLT